MGILAPDTAVASVDQLCGLHAAAQQVRCTAILQLQLLACHQL